MQKCPCTSGKSFLECCEPFIEGKSIPKSPLQLMRSRYTAYTLSNIEYIKDTMRGVALEEFDASSAKSWADNAKWLGLEILSAPKVNKNDKTGYVEFVANYEIENTDKKFKEKSKFKLVDGKWFYVDGIVASENKTEVVEKVGRNSPCHCGSGKKFKKCCQK